MNHFLLCLSVELLALKALVKRAFLQSIYDAVQSQTAQDDLNADLPILDLETALTAFQRLAFNDLKSGKLSAGSSGFQHEVKWAVPAIWRSFDQESLFECQQELREVYEDAIITLTAQSIPLGDANVLKAMMADDRLQRVTSTHRDWTVARLPWGRLG